MEKLRCLFLDCNLDFQESSSFIHECYILPPLTQSHDPVNSPTSHWSVYMILTLTVSQYDLLDIYTTVPWSRRA